jgi:hypothetical protein
MNVMDSTMNSKSCDNYVTNNNDDNESQFTNCIIFLFTLLHGKQLVFLLITLDFAILLKCVLHHTCMHIGVLIHVHCLFLYFKLLLDCIFYNIKMFKNLKIIWQYFKIYILMITFLWKHIDLRFLKDFEVFHQQ